MAFLHLLLLFLFSFTSNSYAQSTTFTPTNNYCNNQKIINPTSQVSININIVLNKLITTTPNDNYAVAAAGKPGVDIVYGLAQCRGDLNKTNCFFCIQDAAKQIRQLCPNQADSRIWYNSCFLRYDTDEFYGQLDDTTQGIIYYNVNNVTEQSDVFEKKLGNLMNKIEKKAVDLTVSKGFGNGKIKLSPFDTIYGMVQCSRDLSPVSCSQCLAIAVGAFGTICSDKQGCRVFYTSCYVRYELYPYLDVISEEII